MAEAATASQTYFLSYSRSDERFALRLANDLRSQGVAVWVDQLDIRPSEHWDRAIERAVRDCRGLIVILSPRSVASDNVADEISYAIDSAKSVLPVMIEKCVLPLRITRMQVIDATRSYDKALKQCLNELNHPDRQACAQEDSAPAAVQQLGPELLATVTRQLATIVGPIAAILVDEAASHAGSVTDLHNLLLQHISDQADRESFAAMTERLRRPTLDVQATPTISLSAKISAEELASIAATLTNYLGPIAPFVARRESRSCNSPEELLKRLAALIPTQQDRDDFLRCVRTR